MNQYNFVLLDDFMNLVSKNNFHNRRLKTPRQVKKNLLKRTSFPIFGGSTTSGGAFHERLNGIEQLTDIHRLWQMGEEIDDFIEIVHFFQLLLVQMYYTCSANSNDTLKLRKLAACCQLSKPT